ncbi:ATP-binding protein [Catenibacterium mitsuokai]|uniref:ATP-binding protein n=1 Tax=Catenibacterium mitsuokai TaxID=100886 RepID=UPI002E783BAD|nr:ATP-binding protein [Catenibacterium mitsuokai]
MIEMVSFPGPDCLVTQEGLKRYKVSNRRYRNRRIGDILKELHLTKGRNTGFGKILSALEENGSPKPEFETDEGHNYSITRLFVHKAFMRQGQKGAEVDLKGAKVGQKGAELGQKGAEVDPKGAKVDPKGAKLGQKGAKKGTERSLEILNRMRENPFVTQVKLMEEFHLSRKQIQNIIQYLRLNGLVEREGSNRSGKWIVKK